MAFENNTHTNDGANSGIEHESTPTLTATVPLTPGQGQVPAPYSGNTQNRQLPSYAYYPPPGLGLHPSQFNRQTLGNGYTAHSNNSGQPANNASGYGYGYAMPGYMPYAHSMVPPGQNNPSQAPMPPSTPNISTPPHQPCPRPRPRPCERPDFELPDDFGASIKDAQSNEYQPPKTPPPPSPTMLPGINKIMLCRQQSNQEHPNNERPKPSKVPKPTIPTPKPPAPNAKPVKRAAPVKKGKAKKRVLSENSDDDDDDDEQPKKKGKGRSEGATAYGTSECQKLIDTVKAWEPLGNRLSPSKP